MSFELDTYAVLRAIGANPHVFASLRDDLVRIAPNLVERQLKARGGDIAGLRAVRQALGGDLFNGATESLGGKKIVALLRKFDKHNPVLGPVLGNGVTESWGAAHLQALAAGKAEPVAAPPRSRRARKSKAPLDTGPARALHARAMSATRQRD